MENTEEQNPIAEAKRYVANAAEIIVKSKYDPETKLYRDKKYVRIAGDTLWKGCLIALDALLHVRQGKGRPSVEKYKKAAAQRDHKLLSYIVAGYETMHLVMGYARNRNGTSNACRDMLMCCTIFSAYCASSTPFKQF